MVKSTADQPVCKTSGKAVPSKGGSTTNLYSHFEDHHPELRNFPLFPVLEATESWVRAWG